MFNEKILIGITSDSLQVILDKVLKGNILQVEVRDDFFDVNVFYHDDEDLKHDMEAMKITEEDLEEFKDERLFFEEDGEFKLTLSLSDIKELINKKSGKILSSSLQYYYDYKSNYIQFIVE